MDFPVWAQDVGEKLIGVSPWRRPRRVNWPRYASGIGRRVNEHIGGSGERL